MIARLLCFSLAAASAYNIPTTRRAVLAKAAAVAPLAAVFPAFAELRYNTRDNKLIDDYGAAQQPKALFTTAEVTSRAPPRAQAGVRIGGKYADPMHPGCKRKVTLIGTNKVLIEGADEDGKPWTVKGTYEGKAVTVDFTPKGGPKDVTATWSIAGGLLFPDGNAWKKLS